MFYKYKCIKYYVLKYKCVIYINHYIDPTTLECNFYRYKITNRFVCQYFEFFKIIILVAIS